MSGFFLFAGDNEEKDSLFGCLYRRPKQTDIIFLHHDSNHFQSEAENFLNLIPYRLKSFIFSSLFVVAVAAVLCEWKKDKAISSSSLI